MAAYYDSIANKYQKTKELPFRQYVEAYTYFNLIGDLSGKSVLDLACGDGLYTRRIKQQGAARVVGVDISPKMIELARKEDAIEPRGIEYIVCDVQEMGKIDSFDLVVASYCLNYAKTQEQLHKMCQTIVANLKPGGRFVSINNNLELLPQFYSKIEKYGIFQSVLEPLQEGTPITISVTSGADGDLVTYENYYLSKSTYEWAFREVGFQEIRWHQPTVSPEGVQEFGKDYWQDFLNFPELIGIECFSRLG